MFRLLRSPIERYARWSSAHPILPLVIVCLVCALCLGLARRIGLDASFDALLPEDTPSVVAREEVRARMGSSDFFVIAANSPDPEANFRFSEDVRQRIEQWDETVWVMNRVDLQIFRDRALLYLELEDLTELVDLVELAVMRGLCEFRGDCAETDLRTAEEIAGDERRLEEIRDAHEQRMEETAGDRSDLSARFPELRDALMTSDGTVAVVKASLNRGTNDIEFAREMMLRGEEIVTDLDPHSYHPEMLARVVGAYHSLDEYDTVVRDATTAALVSLVLVLVLIIVFFRRLEAVLLVGGSLVVGLVWTVGVVALTMPTLNTITAVIFGILLGMGIDYPIHLTVATRAARKPGGSLVDALMIAIPKTVPAMLTSALTTAAALLTLISAQNRGLREFGIMGSFGVLLCLIATLVVVPPLLGLTEKLRRDERPLKVLGDGWSARWGRQIALALLIVLSGLFAWRATQLEFEYNLSNLSAPRRGPGISYGSAMRSGRGSTPVIMLGKSQDQMRRAHRIVQKRRDEGEERIRDLFTIETFVPSDQEAKLEEIERLREVLHPRTIKRVAEADRESLQELARLARVEDPIEFEDLPRWSKQMLTERDGSIGLLGMIYTTGVRTDARDSRAFQNDFGVLDVGEGETVRTASPKFVIADIVYTMIDDGRRMALLAVLAILLLLAIDMRSAFGVLLSLFCLSLGVFWAFGAAEWLSWRLGVFNMLVIPVALGLGIDGAVHVFHRYRRDAAAFTKSPLGVTGFSVLASSLTTVAGFSGLLFVSHRGLLTIGQLAVVTIALTMIAVLGVMPGGLLVLARHKAGKAGKSPTVEPTPTEPSRES